MQTCYSSHLGYHLWLFEFLLPFYGLQPIWPFSSNLWHQQGSFLPAGYFVSGHLNPPNIPSLLLTFNFTKSSSTIHMVLSWKNQNLFATTRYRFPSVDARGWDNGCHVISWWSAISRSNDVSNKMASKLSSNGVASPVATVSSLDINWKNHHSQWLSCRKCLLSRTTHTNHLGHLQQNQYVLSPGRAPN